MLFCSRTQILEKVKGLEPLKAILRRRQFFWLVGFSTCLSLFVEEKVRLSPLRSLCADHVVP